MDGRAYKRSRLHLTEAGEQQGAQIMYSISFFDVLPCHMADRVAESWNSCSLKRWDYAASLLSLSHKCWRQLCENFSKVTSGQRRFIVFVCLCVYLHVHLRGRQREAPHTRQTFHTISPPLQCKLWFLFSSSHGDDSAALWFPHNKKPKARITSMGQRLNQSN